METFVYWDTVLAIQPLSPAPKTKILNSAVMKDCTVLVSEENLHVYSSKGNQIRVRSLEFRFSVVTVANNASLVYFLTDQGQLWGYGTDELKAGLLAEEGVFTTEHPLRLSFFDQQPLSKISISKTHAGGISLEGTLFAWGSGKNGELGDLTLKKTKPQIVQQASFFKSTDVCCGDKYTAVCTEAGFLFLFCKRKNCSNCKKISSFPCTVHNLQNDFVTRVFAQNEDLVIINDLGEVKMVSGCFCVTHLPCKSRVVEIATFEGGLAGLAVDKRVIHTWKKINKNWVIENFSVNYGDVGRVVNGVGKLVGIIGKQITGKSLKKVKDANSLDCSYRSAGDHERVTFEEIVSSMGFKGKIYSMDQGQIFSVIEKLYLKDLKPVFQQIWKHSYYQGFSKKSRNMASAPFILEKTVGGVLHRNMFGVFKQLKKCPKRRLTTIMTLTNKFVTVSIEKYWSIWSSLARGYTKAKVKFHSKLKSVGAQCIYRSINRMTRFGLHLGFSDLKLSDSQGLMSQQKAVFKLIIAYQALYQKYRLNKLHCFFTQTKGLGANSPLSKESLSIDSNGHIEILPTTQKGRTQPPSLSQSFLNESENPLLSKSLTKKGDPEFSRINLSSSLNLTNGTSPHTDPVSPMSQNSPDIKSPDYSLGSQLSKKIGQKKYATNIKLPQPTEKKCKNSGSITSRKSNKDVRTIFPVKDALSPSVIPKSLPTGKVLRKSGNQKSQEIHSLAFLQRPNLVSELVTRLLKRVRTDVLKTILSYKGEGSQKVQKIPVKAVQVSWKMKMYSLAFNKIIKAFEKLAGNKKNHGFLGIKAWIRR